MPHLLHDSFSTKQTKLINYSHQHTNNMQPCLLDWLIDWVKTLRPTWHKVSHFGDVPQDNLLAWYGKTKPNTTKAHIHQSKQMYYNTKKLKPGLVTSYNIRSGNGEGLFLFRRFINSPLSYLDTYPLTYSPGPTRAPSGLNSKVRYEKCNIVSTHNFTTSATNHMQNATNA